MEQDRAKRWIKASFILSKLENFITPAVQQLARLDEKLIQKSKEHHPASMIGEGTLLDFDEYLTLSYLWVLGAYELVRTISQRCREKEGIFTQDTIQKVEEVKRLFTRIRVPLAKMEPAQEHKDTDYSIAFPLNSEHGIGWHVAPQTYILRMQLSNALLDLIETMDKDKI